MVSGKANRKSTGGEISGHYQHKRYTTFWQITVFLVIVYILSGLATFLIYNRSQIRLIDKTEDKLIQMKADNV